jgi:hypothetical protein
MPWPCPATTADSSPARPAPTATTLCRPRSTRIKRRFPSHQTSSWGRRRVGNGRRIRGSDKMCERTGDCFLHQRRDDCQKQHAQEGRRRLEALAFGRRTRAGTDERAYDCDTSDYRGTGQRASTGRLYLLPISAQCHRPNAKPLIRCGDGCLQLSERGHSTFRINARREDGCESVRTEPAAKALAI